jgi:heme exporter protein C
MPLPRWFHMLGSPPHAYRVCEWVRPWLGWGALLLISVGTFWGLVLAPEDYQMGDAFRIIYIHVPTAILGTRVYLLLAVAAAIGFIWRIKLAHAVAVSVAPLGAALVVMAMATGAIWGKPMWGTYWQWGDARLVSWLVQLFLYLGYMALHASFDDRDKADRASAILAVVGVVNVPIIYYSVEWWTTLHQGQTIVKFDAPSITADMAIPLVINIFGFALWFGWLLVNRLQGEIVERERDARWIQQYALETAK